MAVGQEDEEVMNKEHQFWIKEHDIYSQRLNEEKRCALLVTQFCKLVFECVWATLEPSLELLKTFLSMSTILELLHMIMSIFNIPKS